MAPSLLLVPLALGWSGGPPADRVNLCSARLSCNDLGCHDSFPPDAGTAAARLELAGGSPLPVAYKPGEILSLVLAVTDPDASRQRFGFQIGAVTGCPFPEQAGSFTLVEPGRTQVLAAPSGLSFVEHACPGPGDPATCGYLPAPVAGSDSWRFDWAAPDPDQGPVTFYWAINAADGNGFPDNDYVTLWQATLDPNCSGRLRSLRAVRRDCDAGSPGEPDVELSWDPVPFARGYRAYRTEDPAVLADPPGGGAFSLAGNCDSPPAATLYFYTVVGVCADSSDGPS